MAMTYQNFASLGLNVNRQKYGPLDISSVFTSEADLRYYLSKGAETEGVSEYWYKNTNEKIVPYPYEGQVIATVINDDVKVYVLRLDAEGAFEAKAIEPEVDGKTIKLTNGKLELVGLPTDTSKVYVPSLVNGVLTWAEPDTSTAEGQQQAIEGLTTSVAGLSEVINGKAGSGEEGSEDYVAPVVGLVDKVAALEAVDNATQAELDAYKEVVTTAIAAGIKEAKDYADAQDADTIYDDTDLQNRVKAIEDDYLKEEDKYDDTAVKGRLDVIESDYLKKSDETIYDDTALAGRVTTVEGEIDVLQEQIQGLSGAMHFKGTYYSLPVTTSPIAQGDSCPNGTIIKIDTSITPQIEGYFDLVEENSYFDFVKAPGYYYPIEFVRYDGNAFAIYEGITGGKILLYVSEDVSEEKLAELGATTRGWQVSEFTWRAGGPISFVGYKSANPVITDNTCPFFLIEKVDGDFVPGDVIAVGDKEYVFNGNNFVEFGDISAEGERLTTLEDKVKVIEEKPAYSIIADQISNWDNEVGAKALAESKTTAAEVKDQIEAYGYATTSEVATAKQEAIKAAADAEEAKGYAVASEVESTYATKSALEEAVEGIENDLLAYAKTVDVNAELAKKIDKATISHSTEEKAEGATVNGTQLDIVVDAFTKAETRQYVADTITSFTGGESAKDVLLALNNYKSDNDARVGAVETKNGEQDTAIAKAQADATQGINDAKKVSDDLVTANLAIADNTREIGVVKGNISDINTTLSTKIANLEGKDVTIEGNITALQTTVSSHGSDIATHGGAIANLQAEDVRLATLIQGNTDKFADYYIKSDVDTKIKAVSDAVGEIDLSPYAKSADVTSEITTLNSTLTAKIDTKANAADVYTKDDADAKFLTETQVKDVINKVVADVSDTDTIEGLVTLVNYVHDNAGDIAELVATVENNGKAIAQNIIDIAANKVAHEQNASDIVTLTNTVAAQKVIESSEISVSVVEGGVGLGLKEVNVNKLVQTDGDNLILNGGSASNN